MRVPVLVTALMLLLLANIVMMYYMPFGLREGFQPAMPTVNMGTTPPMGGPPTPPGPPAPPMAPPMPPMGAPPMPGPPMPAAAPPMPPASVPPSAPADMKKPVNGFRNRSEGFTSYSLASGGGAKDSYESIGPYDGVRLPTGNSSGWRYTAPNEQLTGPEVEPGPDNLFMFKNNQCKPECCGASFSCDGGCVCTTPKQRDYLNSRGGNRTSPDDGV